MARVERGALADRIFAIVDVETSGISPAFSRVIEIGIVRIERGARVEEYRTCIDPGHRISPWITSLTGIQQEELEGAPTFDAVIDTIERLLSDATFVAHNVAFDYAFIQREFRRAGKLFTAERLCTVRLSRALYPQNKHHDLSSLIERHGFVCESRHRALDDAKVLWDFLQVCQRSHKRKLAVTLDRIIQKRPTPPDVEFLQLVTHQNDEPVIS